MLRFPERLHANLKGHHQAENHQQPNSFLPHLTEQKTRYLLPPFLVSPMDLVIQMLGQQLYFLDSLIGWGSSGPTARPPVPGT